MDLALVGFDYLIDFSIRSAWLIPQRSNAGKGSNS